MLQLFQAYFGTRSHRIGAQHTLNNEYFKRIDALNFTMLHDDGQYTEGLEEATSCWSACLHLENPDLDLSFNRGVRTANVPLVPGIPVPRIRDPETLVVSLHDAGTVDQIRQNRLLGLAPRPSDDSYIDHQSVVDE